MTKFGQVAAYDEPSGMATVTFTRPEACMKCGACGLKAQTGTAVLPAGESRVGDWVRVEMPEGRFLRATAMAYVLPLIGLMAGLGLGWWLGGGGDGATVLGGGIGLGLALGALKINERRIAGKPEWTPRNAEVYHEEPEQAQIGCERS